MLWKSGPSADVNIRNTMRIRIEPYTYVVEGNVRVVDVNQTLASL